MGNAQTWDTSYELVPSNGDSLSSAPLMYAGFTEGIRERIAHEHEITVGSNNPIHGRHLEGSFVGFCQSTCPFELPDGTALSDDHVGVLWFNKNNSVVYRWTGGDHSLGWLPISRLLTGLSNTGGYLPNGLSLYNSYLLHVGSLYDMLASSISIGLHSACGRIARAPSGWPDGADGGWLYGARRETDSITLLMYIDSAMDSTTLISGGTDWLRFSGGVSLGE